MKIVKSEARKTEELIRSIASDLDVKVRERSSGWETYVGWFLYSFPGIYIEKNRIWVYQDDDLELAKTFGKQIEKRTKKKVIINIV